MKLCSGGEVFDVMVIEGVKVRSKYKLGRFNVMNDNVYRAINNSVGQVREDFRQALSKVGNYDSELMLQLEEMHVHYTTKLIDEAFARGQKAG